MQRQNFCFFSGERFFDSYQGNLALSPQQSLPMKTSTLSRFLSAPHRVFFTAGTAQILFLMLWWFLHLAQVSVWSNFFVSPTKLVSAWLHGGLMLFGLFPFFIFGFLMTALPRWMQTGALSPWQFRPPFYLLSLGFIAFYGAIFSAELPIALFWFAGSCVAAGLCWGTVSLWQKTWSAAVDRCHAFSVLLALAFALVGWVAYLFALAEQNARAWDIANLCGLWLFLLPTFFTVLHRMLPFFTRVADPQYYQAYAPMWGLAVFWAACGLRVLLCLSDLTAWAVLPDVVLCSLLLRFVTQWNLRLALSRPMLAVLHLSAAAFIPAFALYAIQDGLLFAGIYWGGRIPLHALTISVLTGLLVGMATRVTRGHSGLDIESERWVMPMFFTVQIIFGLRVLGELFGNSYMLSAALLWFGLFCYWAWRFVPLYFFAEE